MTYNSVTLISNGSLIRWGGTRFDLGAEFDGGSELYTADVGHKIDGLALKYHKIVGGVLAEMTAGEKTTVDTAVVANLSLFGNYYIPIYPKGEEENLILDGAISLNSHSTRLDVPSSGSMTMADGAIQGIHKRIFSDNASDATITCSLDQSVSAYVSFTLAKNGKFVGIWDKSGFWRITEEKLLTRNL